LQGLFFKKTNELNEYFSSIINKLKFLSSLSEKTGVSIASLCLNFVYLNKYIDKVIVGVDSIANIKELIAALDDILKVENVYEDLFSLKEDNERIILPFNWKKEKVCIKK